MSLTMSTPIATSSADMTMAVSMIPWLHFAGGDNLFFKLWHPSSKGAIAGACIGLVVLAILERWLAAMRSVLEVYWRQRTLSMMSKRNANFSPDDVVITTPVKENPSLDIAEVNTSSRSRRSSGQGAPFNAQRPRMTPPFIASHDIPRGIVFAIQALLAYALMLAVMTFQAAYFISIVVGLGLGEILFGRIGRSQGHVAH